MSRPVVVIGAGITGLATAHALIEAGIGPVTVLEGSPRLGGKLAGLELDGVGLDAGAESVLARRPEGVGLIAELGLSDRAVTPTSSTARVLIEGRVTELPRSAMGVPNDLEALRGFLSADGLARAFQEPRLPAPPLTGDVGIGSYLASRFGDEVTDRLLEPLLGGVYAGRSRELSFAAVAPALFARARAGGSLLTHARAATPATPNPAPVFTGLVNGVSGLVPALAAELTRRGAEIRTRTTVRELATLAGGGFRLSCGPAPEPETLDADAVVVATPAGPAGRLLGDLVASAAEYGRIPYASMAVLTFVVHGIDLTGSGLLVPPGQLPTIKALTYSSNKWAWVADQAAAAWGPGTAAVRASIGRYGEEHLLQVGDDALIRRTWAELAEVPGWSGARQLRAAVTRWGGGLPQYLVGHTAIVDRLLTEVSRIPGLAVAGAALNGLGIPACIASGTAAATKISTDLGSTIPTAATKDT